MIRIIKELIPQKHFHLGLSGNNDSLAACHYLHARGYKFTAAHLNNNLIAQDGECADRVENFCKEFGIPLKMERCEETYTKGSIEGFARDCRIKFFNSIGGDIVLCHHLNDCVEGNFWNFLRGHIENIPMPEKTDFGLYTVYRPFLLTTKSSFEKYNQRKNLEKFVTHDELNNNLSLNRNWIRNILIPEVHSRNYNLEKTTLKILHKKLKERGYNI